MSISHLNAWQEKIVWSGKNVTFVPVSPPHSPMTSSGFVTCPRENSMWCTLPPRLTSTFIQSESALTQLTPTPWSPPETL